MAADPEPEARKREPQLVWEATFSQVLSSRPTVADGMVYIGSWDRRVHAFNASDGVKMWSSQPELAGRVHASPTVAGGVLYTATGTMSMTGASITNRLYAINAVTGVQLWSRAFQYGKEMYGAPIVKEGVVFVGSNDGRLYVLRCAPARHEQIVAVCARACMPLPLLQAKWRLRRLWPLSLIHI